MNEATRWAEPNGMSSDVLFVIALLYTAAAVYAAVKAFPGKYGWWAAVAYAVALGSVVALAGVNAFHLTSIQDVVLYEERTKWYEVQAMAHSYAISVAVALVVAAIWVGFYAKESSRVRLVTVNWMLIPVCVLVAVDSASIGRWLAFGASQDDTIHGAHGEPWAVWIMLGVLTLVTATVVYRIRARKRPWWEWFAPLAVMYGLVIPPSPDETEQPDK
jgi:hypothetical protein